MKYKKWQNYLCLIPWQTIQYHSNPTLCPIHQWQRSWSPLILWRPTRTYRTNIKKRYPFHYLGLECKSRKSRETWCNRQTWLWSTKWSRTKANIILLWEHTGHSKYPLSTAQDTSLSMDITRWSITKSDWLYFLQLKMEEALYSQQNKTGSWLWLR